MIKLIHNNGNTNIKSSDIGKLNKYYKKQITNKENKNHTSSSVSISVSSLTINFLLKD